MAVGVARNFALPVRSGNPAVVAPTLRGGSSDVVRALRDRFLIVVWTLRGQSSRLVAERRDHQEQDSPYPAAIIQPMQFNFFDPRKELEVTYQTLPHWEQKEVTYFLTFRAADSMPAEVLLSWKERRNEWLRQHDIDPDNPDWRVRLHLLGQAAYDEFHQAFTAEFQRYLDAGHGECLLKRPELAREVADALQHFDGERYLLGDFIVMPNHAHVLAQFFRGVGMKGQCYSWKKFTAGMINRLAGRSGQYWQTEGYDHIVRDEDEFEHYRRYIADNPSMAGLTEGEYLHWQRG